VVKGIGCCRQRPNPSRFLAVCSLELGFAVDLSAHKDSVAQAYASGGYTVQGIGGDFGFRYSLVSSMVADFRLVY
jgi:hypothetical protein